MDLALGHIRNQLELRQYRNEDGTARTLSQQGEGPTHRNKQTIALAFLEGGKEKRKEEEGEGGKKERRGRGGDKGGGEESRKEGRGRRRRGGRGGREEGRGRGRGKKR